MPLTTLAAPIDGPTILFQFIVPGDKLWKIRSVLAVATRDVGGTPDRTFLLTVSTSTGPVLAVAADDAGAEPGICTVTWTNAPGSHSDAGPLGVSLAPFNPPTLYPGYVITGSIENGAAGDTWESATVWYDFTPSSGT